MILMKYLKNSLRLPYPNEIFEKLIETSISISLSHIWNAIRWWISPEAIFYTPPLYSGAPGQYPYAERVTRDQSLNVDPKTDLDDQKHQLEQKLIRSNSSWSKETGFLQLAWTACPLHWETNASLVDLDGPLGNCASPHRSNGIKSINGR